MIFSEKLQLIRKSKGMTQEDGQRKGLHRICQRLRTRQYRQFKVPYGFGILIRPPLLFTIKLAFLMLDYTEIIGLPTMSIAMQLLCRNV